MTIVDLNLIKLNQALVEFYCALLLQNELFLIIQSLFRYSSPCPRLAIPLGVHLPLCQKAFISVEGSLSLQQSRAIGAIVNINQRVAFANNLPLFVVHCSDDSVDLAGDGGGVNRSDGANRIEINSDIAFLRACGYDGCRTASSPWRPRVGGRILMFSQDQIEGRGKNQQ